MPPMRPPDSGLPEHGDDSAERRRIACAEINARRVNEALERGHRSSGPLVVMCECGRLGCNTKFEMSVDQYEGVRTSFERFLVCPGHEVPTIDVVAEHHDGFSVVVKQGDFAEMAGRADERTDSDDGDR